MKALTAVKEGLKKSYKTILVIIKIVVPVYFLIKVLEYTNILAYISNWFSPFMKIFGLPGESAIVLLTGGFLNLYGAIAAIGAFTFTKREITIIAIMLLFSHSLPLETSILKKLNISRTKQILLRVSVMILIGIILNLVW